MTYGAVRGVEKPVSRVVLGSVTRPGCDPGWVFDVMDTAFDKGINCFDTAHQYADGDADRMIGRWIAGRRNRENVIILAKGCHHSDDRRRVTPHDLTSDLMDTLARMKTDYVDLFLLHRDDPEQPVGAIVEALNEHHEAGRVLAFGASNWTWQRMEAANVYAEAHGLMPFAVSSQHFSLAEQFEDPWGGGCVSVAGPRESTARAWHTSAGIPLFAYASLSGGLFSGRFSSDTFAAERDAGRIEESTVRAYCHPRNLERLDRAIQLANERSVSTAQIAIAFVLSHVRFESVDVHAIVGAADTDEVLADVKAAEIELSPEEIAWLDLKTARRDSAGAGHDKGSAEE